MPEKYFNKIRPQGKNLNGNGMDATMPERKTKIDIVEIFKSSLSYLKYGKNSP